MKNALTWRFVIIALIVAAASYIVRTYPLLLGIDLAGGTSLLYELDLSKIQNSGQSNSELANRVVEVLKKRVDPSHLKNFIWRVIGDRRIQVQMPLADKATRDARARVDETFKALDESSLKPAQIARLLELKGDARSKAIDDLVKPSDPRNQLIKDLATANDELQAATAAQAAAEQKLGVAKVPQEVRDRKFEAQKNYDDAKAKLDATNVDVNQLKSVLAAADDPDNKAAQKQLAQFTSGPATAQRAAVQAYIDAHKKLMSISGGGVEDPADLQRMLTAAGVLDFRITVKGAELGGPTSAEFTAAVQSLKKDPQRAITVAGEKARWFEIDPKGRSNFSTGGPSDYVIATWAGEPYILCYDDPSRALTHSQGKDWTVTAGSPYPDPRSGQLVLPFKLDSVGGSLMGDLTSGNINRSMAILLDDKAMSAPNINSTITDSGEITFGDKPSEATQKEANELQEIMDAGSLPATLQKDPISVVNITPDMGKDNIDAGVHSGFYAMIAVLAFMVLYYTITGLFADLALAINLLLVLAVMAFVGGTFTLPGIAGLVLTLGMAVDANVLINERIREELHKGASLWMAVKQGYDKVFWTIFDANLTTSLTSIVLIYVGSEEVKGFGVTLLIGLCIHMFTALFVTRTLMMGAIKVGIIRAIDDHSLTEYLREIFTFTWLRNGHWPFMRVITVSNIDWIGKRHIFWVISAITIIAGLVVFVMRGDDKYDIEFRGGTQITFQLKPGVDLSRDQVEKKIKELKGLPGLADLESARIYGIGKPEEHTFQMQTTIANTKDDPAHVKTVLLEPLAEHLKDYLNLIPPVSLSDSVGIYCGSKKGETVPPKDVGQLMDRGIVVPIQANTLDHVFEQTPIHGMPNVDVSDELHGVAVLLDNISPPQTAAQLTQRITETRGSPDMRSIPSRSFKIIPITAADPKQRLEDAGTLLTRAVMVSKDEGFPYTEGSEWRDKVAATEWQIVSVAMQTNTLFQGVTSFDAVVAGQAKMAALLAIALSLILIVAYVWIRFGGIRYGIGAILSLIHDAVVAVAATVLSGVIYNYVFHKHAFLLISDFKINLTMIAAYLTVIGYSVNDTIVIFDRVRELRGKSHSAISAKLVNDAINQCFGRTIWTTFTVFIVVLIMYVWGGEGIRGFSFAMLVGVITGAYSTLAIASPMLLATASAKDKAPAPELAIARRNPFRPLDPEVTERK